MFKGKPKKNNKDASRMKRMRRPGMSRRKVCKFCADYLEIDFKDANLLRNFVSDRGKILAGRITGVCSKHQRVLTSAIKRARMIALLPYLNY